MPIHNADIAAIFEQIAELLEIEEANPFRVRAYRNAARTLEGLGHDVRTLLKRREHLEDLPGIGKDLAAKIHEIVDTGSCEALNKLQRRLPPVLTDLLAIPGLGPKRVKTIYHELDVQTVEQLHRAAQDKRIRGLPGFGEKTERQILEATEAQGKRPVRTKLAVAGQYVEALLDYLKAVPGVERVEAAGSYRRARETVGDLDILAVAPSGRAVIEAFAAYDEVREAVSGGATRSTVILKSGLQVDLRVVPAESFGAALQYFTGSKAHNIALRRLGQQAGLKVNEYGVFRGEQRIAGESEASVYSALGLLLIPPELREDRGEIQEARSGRLPDLVEPGELRGDLHAHTRATDGHNTLAEMAAAAREQGLEYLGITEHSRRLAMAHGLDPERLLKQCDEIDRLNLELDGITLLKGIEVDILEDGRLDLPDDVLGRLDLVIGAVHSGFHLSRAKQTRRILKAMDHPHFSILAHPTGRLLLERDPYDVDMLRIVRHARQRGCFLELNANPRRLDLLDVHCRLARDEGVLVSIDSDAHGVRDFANLRYGVGQARRGWLEPADVLNTRSLRELRPLLRQTL